ELLQSRLHVACLFSLRGSRPALWEWSGAALQCRRRILHRRSAPPLLSVESRRRTGARPREAGANIGPPRSCSPRSGAASKRPLEVRSRGALPPRARALPARASRFGATRAVVFLNVRRAA